MRLIVSLGAATLLQLPIMYAKVIPIPRAALLKGRDYWTDVEWPPSPTSTMASISPATASECSLSTGTYMTSGTVTATQQTSSRPQFTSTMTSTCTACTTLESIYDYIEPADYDPTDDAGGEDTLLFMQDEIYTLVPDAGIEFDCPDDLFTMYFDESVVINGTLQDWGETFESGIMLIPNNWTSYCGDISDWTLYGYSDPDVEFSDADEQNEYFESVRDPQVQYVVVVLHQLVEVNWLNRSLTFEAYADDFRAVIGALTTAPEEYDYFTPGPIGNTTDDVDFFETGLQRRDVPRKSPIVKRGGVGDLAGLIKAIPGLGKVAPDALKTGFDLVNQGIKMINLRDLTNGPKDSNPFTNKDVSISLDLSKLPQYPGWGGFTYQLYQFYFEGNYWAELWRTAVAGGNNQASVSVVTSSQPYTGTFSTSTGTSTSASSSGSTSATTTYSSTAAIPSCTWAPNKQPLDKQSSWKDIFKVDAEKLVTTGQLPFPLRLLDIPGVVRAGFEAKDALVSAHQVLKHFTILPRSSTTTATTVSPVTAVPASTTTSLVATTTTGPADGVVLSGSTSTSSAAQVASSTPALAARQEFDTSFYDNCDVSILDWDIEFMFGNVSVTVLPPAISLRNYALKNRASIQLTCKDRFFETRETEYLRITSVPIGGCATKLGDFEIDAFFVLFLSSVFSSGSNGSIVIDYSYTWDPINFELELLGNGPNNSIQLDAAKLGVGLPSSSGLQFDYLRATASFPNIEIGLALSPAFQVDVITPLVNYTRGIMLGPAVNVLSNGTFSIGYNKSSSSSTPSSSAAPAQNTGIVSDGSDFIPSTDVVDLVNNGSSSTPGIFDGSGIDVLTGMSWGLMWTDYTYQRLGGPLSTVLTLPSSKSKVGWLFGPYKFWSRDPS